MLVQELESLVTGRVESLFRDEMESHRPILASEIRASRIAVIGAAGSIGSSLVIELARFRPRGLALVDLDENGLVEVVRDLRSRPDLSLPEDFRALPIGLGSRELGRYLAEAPRFEYVFNLSAVKHVRSEKDVYSLARLLDTNVLALDRLLESLPYRARRIFSVSSDKAVNPASLMGASKWIMEQVLWLHSERQSVSSSRFANVAFSNGSLPYGILRRIEKSQPIAAPAHIRRYFISHREAAELCLLSGFLGGNREVFFPKLEPSVHEETLAGLTDKVLRHLGYEPVECASEDEAKRRAAALIPSRKWPCYFFPSETTGEKPFEEFHRPDEGVVLDRYPQVGVIENRREDPAPKALLEFFGFARRIGEDSAITKARVVEMIRRAVPTLAYVDMERNLDQGM